MTIQGYVMEKESPISELAMLLVGDYKSGKTWLAATAPGNILILDMDRRLKSLATHPNQANIFGLEFIESAGAAAAATGTAAKGQTAAQAALAGQQQAKPETPTAFNEMLEIVSRLETTPYLRNLHETFSDAGDRMVDTVVFDSIQSISNAARNYVTYVAPELAKVITIGTRHYRVASTWNAWGSEEMMVTSMIMQCRAIKYCRTCAKPVTVRKAPDGRAYLTHTDADSTGHAIEARGLNVICTLHEAMERAEGSTDENPILTGRIEVFPRRYNKLLMYFNEIWRLRRENGRIPEIQFDPDNKFVQAATALGLPDMSKLSPEQRVDMATILRLARIGPTTKTQKENSHANNQNPQGGPRAATVVSAGVGSSTSHGAPTGKV